MNRSWPNQRVGPRRRPRLEALEDRTVPALTVTDMTGGVTAAQLVGSLVGPGVAVTNVNYTGAAVAAGLFSGGNGIIGFDSGVVLGSGRVTATRGPNTSDGLGGPADNSLGTPGDSDLDAISSPTSDASVLQFDFIPSGTTLRFDYVFSSEEYNEFVSSGVNDVFAFFLNGVNVALLPGTTTPVSIDTVNLNTNSQFYVNNAESADPNPAPPPLRDTEMDGLTVVLTVTATVNPDVPNTIKLAIADGGDSLLDSNVFIRAGSFSAPRAPVFTAYRPLRYAFHSLEQNLGLSGPVPVGGPASEESFDGNITLLNTGTADAVGNLRVTLRDLPPGVQLLNRTGVDPVSGDPFILVQNNVLPQAGVLPLRVPVKLSNPGLFSLGTFFVGPYFVDVSIG